MLRRLLHFLSNMDAKAWLTALIMFLLAGGVGFIFLLAVGALGFRGEALVEQWLGFAAHSPYALVIAIGVFAVLAFVGVPQVVLIAAAVVAFGPWVGALYSWIGTMVSACIGFGLGRVFGARLIRDYGGEGVNKFIGLIGRNGFLASLVVRLVPAGTLRGGEHGGRGDADAPALVPARHRHRHRAQDRADRHRRQFGGQRPAGRAGAEPGHSGPGAGRLAGRRALARRWIKQHEEEGDFPGGVAATGEGCATRSQPCGRRVQARGFPQARELWLSHRALDPARKST